MKYNEKLIHLLISLHLYTQYDEKKLNFPKMKIANLQAHDLLKYLSKLRSDNDHTTPVPTFTKCTDFCS